VQLGDVVDGGNGVYRMEKVHVEVGAERVAHDDADAAGLLSAVNGIAITGVDPGQVLAVSGATALGEHWRREQAGEFVSDPAGEDVRAFEVTGETYRTWALSLCNEQGEADRRNANPEYAEAVAALAAEHTRTGDIEVSWRSDGALCRRLRQAWQW
jgi:hypothetical protein